MNFKEAQDYLDSLQMHKIKLGLDAMENFLDMVARPDRKLRFVHVAGTNGKGSVAVNIVTILLQAGYRVGLFTSPHLSSVRERFRVNEHYISEEKFAEIASRIRQVLGEDKITYFEFTTALALLWFAESQVDLVVLETGLGGRLDATNVVTPLVSVITNVSMDHELYLGNDLSSVAYEKAGIVKENIPLVTGVGDDIGREIVEKKCLEKGAPMYLLDRDFYVEDQGGGFWRWRSCMGQLPQQSYADLQCGMKGAYQRENSAIAIAAVTLLQEGGFSVTEKDIRQGLAAVLWPGRLEYIELSRSSREPSVAAGKGVAQGVYRYLIDGAHNPAGVKSLELTLAAEYQYAKLIVIWGAMEDKDQRLTLPSIAIMAKTVILTQPQGERAAQPSMLLEVLPEYLKERCRLIANVGDALGYAEKIAAADDLIVIAGSLYLIGEIRRTLLGELVE